METADLKRQLLDLRGRNRQRDARMDKIATARTPGGLAMVYPDMFPSEGPYQEPMVANMVDIAARDISEVIAPLPSISCSSSKSVSDRARRFAEKRSKIAQGYVDASNLQVAMYTAADRYVTYGFVVGVISLNFDDETPVIRFPDPRGCYLLRDKWGRIVRVFWVVKMARMDVEQQFPELAARLRKDYYSGSDLEIVRWHDKDSDGIFTTYGTDGHVLKQMANPVGEILAHEFARPGLYDDPIGQFDDVLAVQVAKARFALLALEAAQKAVQAPIALPSDVQDLSLGPDAVLRSAFPEKIRRIGLDVPSVAFAEQGQLEEELRRGARYPEARTGNVDQSIITGKGVQALMTGFDTQIRTAQAIFSKGLGVLVGKCFEADEKVWPNTEKTLRGNDNGTPYEINYTASKDIKGDYTVDAQYGLMAGLNPNQALVFGLQARGDLLISRDFLRRQMPFALDATEEEAKIDVENLRDALKDAFSATAQAVPAMAGQGQDPSDTLRRMAQVIDARQKGRTIEQAVTEVFAPKEEEMSPAAAMGGLGMNEAAALGGGGLPGMPPPGEASMGMGGPATSSQIPDVMGLMANIGSRGQGNLDASIRRQVAI